MSMFVNRVLQVLRTYVTRKFVWMPPILMTLVLVPYIAEGMVRSSAAQTEPFGSMFMLLGFPAYWCAFVVVSQAKRQFAHPRARLTPGFAAPHLFVALLLCVTFGVLLPLLVSMGRPLSAVGLVAYACTVLALIIWSTHTFSSVWGIAGVIAWLSPMMQPGLQFWGMTSAGDTPEYLWFLVVGSWCAIGAYCGRIVRLDEEADDYGGTVDVSQFDSSARADRARRQQFRFLSKRGRFGWSLSDWWHDRLIRRREIRPLSHSQLQQYGFDSQPVWVRAVWMGALLVFLGWFHGSSGLMHWQSEESSSRTHAALMFPLIFGAVMPPLLGYLQLLRRWPRLESELLRPVSRVEFVQNLFVSVAKNAAVMAAAILGGLVLVGPLLLSEPIAPGVMVMFLLLSSAVQALGFTLGLDLLTSRRSTIGYLFLTCAVMMLSVVIAAWWALYDNLGHGPFVIAALAYASLAVLTWRRAHRNWLDLEFGAVG